MKTQREIAEKWATELGTRPHALITIEDAILAALREENAECGKLIEGKFADYPADLEGPIDQEANGIGWDRACLDLPRAIAARNGESQ